MTVGRFTHVGIFCLMFMNTLYSIFDKKSMLLIFMVIHRLTILNRDDKMLVNCMGYADCESLAANQPPRI
jgi:hypothetical protein